MRSPGSFLALLVALALGGCGGGMLGGPPPPHGGGGVGGSVTITGTGNVPGTGTGAVLGTGAGTGTGASTGTGGTVGPNCGAVSQPLRRLTPEVLLLLDRSASMNLDGAGNDCGGDCGATSRWAQLTTALDRVVAVTSAKVDWGLKSFADADGTCGVDDAVAVPVGPSNWGVVSATMAGWSNASGSLRATSQSPARAAENAAAAYLSALESPDPKLILLATAGSPDCALGSADPTVDDSPGAVNAVQIAWSLGIPTLVAGIATPGTSADATLATLATAGGMPRSGSPSYYSVATASELADVLDSVVAGGCAFALRAPSSGYQSNDNIDVFADGVKIPEDTTNMNGWNYTDAPHTAIRIYGATCDALNAGTFMTVVVSYRCLIG